MRLKPQGDPADLIETVHARKLESRPAVPPTARAAISPLPRRDPAAQTPPVAPAPPARASDVASGAPDPSREAPPALSLRVVVPAIAVALLALAMLGAAQISERNSRAILMREIETRLLLEARTLANTASSALLGQFPELTLHPLVHEMLAQRPELALAVVVDHGGILQGTADARALGSRFESPAGLVPVAARFRLEPQERLLQNSTLLVASVPVRAPAAGVLGTAWVGMKRGYLESAIADARRRQWMLMLVLLAAAAISTSVLITVLLRPIGVLRQGLERIGRGDLETRLEVRDRTELGLLAHTVNHMTGQLRLAQREALERERLAREVELARTIQQSLLPHGRLQVGRFVLEGSQRAAAEVGGDYYDILPLGGERVGVTIADVAGKGLGGCLVMSMLSALLRALRLAHASPAKLIVALEENLLHTLPRGSFVTMFYGVLDAERGRLTFVSAGHTPILAWRAATRALEWHHGKGIPIGAVRGGALARSLTDRFIDLEPGDLLVHFTDGYNEAMRGGDGEQFGLERIAQVVAQHAERGASAVIPALEEAVHEWAGTELPSDDETLLVLQCSAPTGAWPAPGPVARADAVAPPLPFGNAPVHDPMELLARARAAGERLELQADFEQLTGLRAWIESCADFRGLDPAAGRLLECALYELCANVVEHGYALDPARTLALSWVPGRHAAGATAAERMRAGCFVLQDHGAPFRAPHRPLLDFNDPQVRRRGRGIGLDMIRRIVRSTAYHPGTPEGNLTVVWFDPASAGAFGETS